MRIAKILFIIIAGTTSATLLGSCGPSAAEFHNPNYGPAVGLDCHKKCRNKCSNVGVGGGGRDLA